MALIKCPECGRENVSDTALICPECGYEIKKHLEKNKKEEYKKSVEYAKKRRKRKLLLMVIVLSIILFCTKDYFLYRMSTEMYEQWDEAIHMYKEWTAEKIYAYNEIYSYIEEIPSYYTINDCVDELEKHVHTYFDVVKEIEKIPDIFPEKYRNVAEKLCSYQKLYSVVDLDLDVLQQIEETDDEYYDKAAKVVLLREEIEKMEEYINNKYLNIADISFSTGIMNSYYPKTFSYAFSEDEKYCTDTISKSDMETVWELTDQYCEELAKSDYVIDYINSTSRYEVDGNYAYTIYMVRNGIINDHARTRRKGIVSVRKNSDLTFTVTGIEYEEWDDLY